MPSKHPKRPKIPKFQVVRDTREQERGDGWWFDPSPSCDGTLVQTLKTGDYTLAGLPDKYFVIERKSGVAEVAGNITELRFKNELERLDEFQYPFLIIEADLGDVERFPVGSGIPQSKWSSLKISNHFLLKVLTEYHLRYKTRIIFAGHSAKLQAQSLFKRIMERYHAGPG